MRGKEGEDNGERDGEGDGEWPVFWFGEEERDERKEGDSVCYLLVERE